MNATVVTDRPAAAKPSLRSYYFRQLFWTEDRVVRLLKLRDAGLSFAAIGREMGLTKGQVIGKHRRLVRGQ